jgi:cytochrome bd-type quinol oxidase subunit 1
VTAVDLARDRFASTTIQQHRRFVPLTIGSALLSAVLPTRFLGTLLVINAIVGVVAGRPDGPGSDACSALAGHP